MFSFQYTLRSTSFRHYSNNKIISRELNSSFVALMFRDIFIDILTTKISVLQ
jgi:hypothetical protein